MNIPQVRHISTYHADMRAKGVDMSLMGFYTEPKQNGHTGRLRQKGYVVSGYAGNDSHKFFTSKAHAYEFQHSKITY